MSDKDSRQRQLESLVERMMAVVVSGGDLTEIKKQIAEFELQKEKRNDSTKS